MSRYTRPAARLWVEDEVFPSEESLRPALTVCDHEPTDTGLLWPDGCPVLRAPNPIGFHVEMPHD